MIYRGQDMKNWSIKERGEKIGFVMQSPNQMISKPMIFDEVALGLVIRHIPEAEIKELIATMYALRAAYEGKLDAVVQSAIDEYAAGEHTSANRTKVVYSKMDELVAMEKACDSEVAAVVSRLRELLKATGQDDTLAKQVEETYKEEKSLKKAAYIEEFRNG